MVIMSCMIERWLFYDLGEGGGYHELYEGERWLFYDLGQGERGGYRGRWLLPIC